MPQLMPLNWIMSVIMFMLVYISMCSIYSVVLMNSDLSLATMSVNKSEWFW